MDIKSMFVSVVVAGALAERAADIRQYIEQKMASGRVIAISGFPLDVYNCNFGSNKVCINGSIIERIRDKYMACFSEGNLVTDKAIYYEINSFDQFMHNLASACARIFDMDHKYARFAVRILSGTCENYTNEYKPLW